MGLGLVDDYTMPAELVNPTVSRLALSLNGCVRLPSEMVSAIIILFFHFGGKIRATNEHMNRGAKWLFSRNC